MIAVLNKRKGRIPPDAVYVGRPTIFGNPFVIGRDGTRSEVIEKFRKYFYERLLSDPHFKEAVLSLRGASALVCWCAPESCHASVIAEYLAS